MKNKFSRGTSQGRQNLIILLCWFVYSFAYFGRYSYSSSINSLIENYNVDKAETGFVMTCFFVVYGLGQVVNGFLCKKYPSRFILSIALWGSSLVNVILFLGIRTGNIGEYFYLVKYVWLINGIFQSLLMTSIIYIFGKNLENDNLAKAGLVFGTTVPAGTFLAYSICTLMEHFGMFELTFLIASVIMSIIGFAWFLLYTPNERTDIESTKEDEENSVQPTKHKKRGISVFALLTVGGLAVFAVSNNFIKDGLQTWIPTMLKEVYNFSNVASLILATSIYMFGMIGVFIVKKISKKRNDYVFLSIRFAAVAFLFIGGIKLFLNVSYIPVVIFFASVIVIAYGINNIVTSLAPLSLRDEINPGTVAGVLDGFCYVGSALSTYLLGLIADKYTWDTVITVVLITIISAVIIVSLIKLITDRIKNRVAK